ncbi:ABC transporter substrate-binding protein [Actinomadura rudentiformis]|uniref:Sugar ABC transporter substrate-binding protein n=1 Tax=Actinomadura rudentiformis TaxID=359158 RepID=A0A6H9YYX9_9ACTN|nr:sugar ABC transporter substrate-binding protein [Actinomadura rudentiformis]KAB2349554.1 sugar ABC transporter substrate-binding protein [Actinomadura rudentiformis]
MSRRGPLPGLRSRLTAASAIAVGACLALTGCGGSGESSGGDSEITFWDSNASASGTPVWQHIISEFQKSNPKIKVKYVSFPIAQAQAKYDTAIASGGTPDVGLMSTSLLANVAGQQALEPLDDRLAGSSLNGKLSPKLLELVKAAGPDGKLYELPQTTNTGILWYRSDWFKEKNVKPPLTWADFYTAADKLTDSGNNRFGFTIRGGAGSIAQILEFAYAQSGISQFWDASGKTTVNAPQNVAAVEKVVALYKKNTPSADVNNDYLKMNAQFDGGSIAMMQHNLGSYVDHQKALKGKFAGTTVPPSPDGSHVLLSSPVGGLSVFKKSKKKDAGWKFAEFVSSKAMSDYWNSKVGQIPANVDSANEAWVKENPTLESAVKVVSDPKTKIVQMPYYLPEFNAITKADSEPLYQKVLLGQMTVKEFLDQLAGKLNEAQTKYKERKGG